MRAAGGQPNVDKDKDDGDNTTTLVIINGDGLRCHGTQQHTAKTAVSHTANLRQELATTALSASGGQAVHPRVIGRVTAGV